MTDTKRNANPASPRLFTYTIPVDDGAAPNPFRGMCTLAICKPGIRRVAKKGDWIAGLGSKNSPSGDLSGHLVYAMLVEEVLTLREYDAHARSEWSYRISDVSSPDILERLGDCIYDYSDSDGKVRQRPSVHGALNVDTDLSGENALISHDFYYLGRKAIKLPSYLHSICHQTQGHRSDKNAPFLDNFVSWLRNLELESGRMYGWPDFAVDWSKSSFNGGCAVRKEDGENDPPC